MAIYHSFWRLLALLPTSVTKHIVVIAHSQVQWLIQYVVSYGGEVLYPTSIPSQLIDIDSVVRTLSAQTGRLYNVIGADLETMLAYRQAFSCVLDQELRRSEYPDVEAAILEAYSGTREYR